MIAGDLINVTIERIVPRGLGIGFAEGLTVLVALAAPGDELRVRLTEVKKRLAFAEIVDILVPGPQRGVPPCPYFGTCGGCDFQQLTYEGQLEAKVGIIHDCLRRIGKIDEAPEIEIIPSPSPLGYRSRSRWHLDPENKAIGYFRRDSHEVVDVSVCPILVPELESELRQLRETIDWNTVATIGAEIEAAVGDGGVVHLDGVYDEQQGGLSFSCPSGAYSYSAGVFFQANQLIIEKLIETATGGAEGGLAYDLYCGVGLFTVPLARRFAKVVGVEDDAAAIEFAKTNVERAGLSNVTLRTGAVSSFLRDTPSEVPDLVLIDPPRAGTEKITIPRIIDLAPRQISYVSCEPSILARDLRIFLDAGYAIERMTALDLFPQSHHVETVARLKLER